MIRKHNVGTYEKAKEEAEAILWEYRNKDSESMKTTHRTKSRDGKQNPFSYIRDDETGATACIYSFNEESYSIIFLTAEESKKENRIFPYRDVTEELLPFLLAINTKVVKPTKIIPIDEALTPEAIEEVNRLFGDADGKPNDYLTEEALREKNYTIDTAFVEYEEEDGTLDFVDLVCNPFPEVLTKITGVKIKTPSDYAKGIAKLLNAELTEEQQEGAKHSFIFNASYAFLRYAVYEFFRTEDYNHLKEVLSQYKKFGLPNKWEADSILNRTQKAEEYVVAIYLSNSGLRLMGVNNSAKRLKDIAEYTETPYSIVLRASNIKHTDM